MKKILREAVDLASYRGGVNHWSFILHRLTGLGVLAFLVIHIVDTALIGWGPDLFNKVISLYRHPFFRTSEIFLFGAVLFHAVNGVRILLVDLWPGATRRHKKLAWGAIIVFFLLYIPAALIMIRDAFFGGHA
jgi:succinate dehydrogenase / fumarate reductase cytochrome b subunit